MTKPAWGLGEAEKSEVQDRGPLGVHCLGFGIDIRRRGKEMKDTCDDRNTQAAGEINPLLYEAARSITSRTGSDLLGLERSLANLSSLSHAVRRDQSC